MTGIFYLESGWIFISPQRLDLFVTLSGIILITFRVLVLANSISEQRTNQGYLKLALYGSLGLVFLYGMHQLGALICWHAISHTSQEGKQEFREYLGGYTFYVLYSLTLLAVVGIQTFIEITNDTYIARLRVSRKLRFERKQLIEAFVEDPLSDSGLMAALKIIKTDDLKGWSIKQEHAFIKAYLLPSRHSLVIRPHHLVQQLSCALCGTLYSLGELIFDYTPFRMRNSHFFLPKRVSASLSLTFSTASSMNHPKAPRSSHLDCILTTGMSKSLLASLLTEQILQHLKKARTSPKTLQATETLLASHDSLANCLAPPEPPSSTVS